MSRLYSCMSSFSRAARHACSRASCLVNDARRWQKRIRNAPGILHCHSISEDVISSSHAMCAAGREVKSRGENQLADASSQPLRGRWLGLDSSLRRRPAPRVPSSKLTKPFLRPLGSGANTVEAYANLSMRDTPLASPRCAAIEALYETVLQTPVSWGFGPQVY